MDDENRSKKAGREKSKRAAVTKGAPTTPTRLRRKIETVGELLHWSYANLAAAYVLGERGLAKHDSTCWMVRAKLLTGLRAGPMNKWPKHCTIPCLSRAKAGALTELPAPCRAPSWRRGVW